jgi:CheY-like chemotaxis protein
MKQNDSQPMILAVDDNPAILMTVENFLVVFDYEVKTATNAPDALGIIRDGSIPAILFSDIVMPGAIDGIELARIVQKTHPDVGILLMTGWSYDNSHGFPVLTKPFQLSELSDWVGRFFEAENAELA